MLNSTGQTIVFDGSFDGFLCAVYAIYYEKINPVSVQTQNDITLADNLLTVETDASQAKRVFSAIKEKISHEAAHIVYNAFLSFEQERFVPIVKYIKHGFLVGHMVNSYLQLDYVRFVQKIASHTGREAHKLHGFCRFVETKQGVLYAQITPKNDCLVLVAEHFKERLMNEAWVIHDKLRSQAAVYDGNSCVIVNAVNEGSITLAPKEEETQDLWVTFFNNIAIKERTNKNLQRQLLPLYFRKNMTEFIGR